MYRLLNGTLSNLLLKWHFLVINEVSYIGRTSEQMNFTTWQTLTFIIAIVMDLMAIKEEPFTQIEWIKKNWRRNNKNVW